VSSERPAAVLFDLGNTLVAYYRQGEFDAVLRRCVHGMLAVLREHAPSRAVDFDAALARATKCNRERDDYRVWPLADRLGEIFALDEGERPALAAPLTAAFLAPIFATARIDPQAVDVLRAIKALGIKTAIVSNTPWGSPAAPWRAEIDRHGLLAEVDAAVFCVDTGWRKPAAPVFARSLQSLDVPAHAAWFVGDDPRWDVDGARNAGLKPILLATPGSEPRADAVTSLAEIPRLLRFL
jgi:putative hydrolase of the HAD superfamily